MPGWGSRSRRSGTTSRWTGWTPALIASYGGPAKLLEDMGRQNLAVRDETKLALQPDPGELDAAPRARQRPASPGRLGGGHRRVQPGDREGPEPGRRLRRPGLGPALRRRRGLRGRRPLLPEPQGLARSASRPTWPSWVSSVPARPATKTTPRTLLDEAIANSAAGAWPLPVLRYLRHESQHDVAC